jgi:hypothetical protein
VTNTLKHSTIYIINHTRTDDAVKAHLFERADLMIDMKEEAKCINSNETNKYKTALKVT